MPSTSHSATASSANTHDEFFQRETGNDMDVHEAIAKHRSAARERARTGGDAQVRRLTVAELELILANVRKRIEADPTEREASLPLMRRCALELHRRHQESVTS